MSGSKIFLEILGNFLEIFGYDFECDWSFLENISFFKIKILCLWFGWKKLLGIEKWIFNNWL